MTHRWREMDSNPRSPVAGRGQAARNQIFRRTTGAEEYVRRNKAADRLVRRAPDQASQNLPPRPFLFLHRRARRGVYSSVIVGQGVDERIALHQDKASPGRIEEGYMLSGHRR